MVEWIPSINGIKEEMRICAENGLGRKTATRKLLKLYARSVEGQMRQWVSQFGIRLISGPNEVINLTPTDLIVVGIVRDGELHVESYLQHHFNLGARHIVLVDNNSDDNTIAKAQEFANVTVLQTSAPFNKYQNAINRYLLDRFGRNCWCLIADIDERFDFPMSDQISLGEFLGYQNSAGFTAVTAQMLDLFPDGVIANWPVEPQTLVAQCKWFDNSTLAKEPFRLHSNYTNRISNPKIHALRGGIRKSVFGVQAHLTKVPLLYRPGGARSSYFTPHDCCCANISDVSSALLHYKFHGMFYRESILAIERENHWNSSQEYKAYLKKLTKEQDLQLKLHTAQELHNLDQLVENGFLIVSESYRSYVKRLRHAR